MSIVKNPLLGPLQSLIGVAPSGQPLTLDDSNISLVLPIIPEIARRGQVIGNLTGWFQGILENVHSGADNEISSIDPYAAGADAVPPFPQLVEDNFDLWLLGAMLAESSGTPALVGGIFSMNTQGRMQGFGRDDQGAPVVAQVPLVLAAWNGTFTAAAYAPGDPCTLVGSGELFKKLGLRIPRGAVLRLHTTSGAAGEFHLSLLMGLFPAGLGQDVVT